MNPNVKLITLSCKIGCFSRLGFEKEGFLFVGDITNLRKKRKPDQQDEMEMIRQSALVLKIEMTRDTPRRI
jgi:hypothetical protein